jgi:hypothetical protein
MLGYRFTCISEFQQECFRDSAQRIPEVQQENSRSSTTRSAEVSTDWFTILTKDDRSSPLVRVRAGLEAGD